MPAVAGKKGSVTDGAFPHACEKMLQRCDGNRWVPQPRYDEVEVHGAIEQTAFANLEREPIETTGNQDSLKPGLRDDRDPARGKSG